MTIPNPQLNAIGKRDAVREMFAEIAPTYDVLNHLLSANIDKRWRRLAVDALAGALRERDNVLLDLCCGTCDLTIELAERNPAARVIGCDFCHPMLVVGASKSRDPRPMSLVEGDALRLPFADDSFAGVTIAFGLRNLENVEAGLREILRILKPGGRAVILEFSRPIVPFFRGAFNFYFSRILPLVGGLISGSRGAYTYLPVSVQNFPRQERLTAMMVKVGYCGVGYRNLSLGIAALHSGDKPAK